jgi:hypothetical protein
VHVTLVTDRFWEQIRSHKALMHIWWEGHNGERVSRYRIPCSAIDKPDTHGPQERKRS